MIDRITVKVRAGNGGNGSASFRHEKFVPFGGPDGGDGANGGDIVIVASDRVNDLGAYRFNQLYRAKNGGNGLGKKMHGKRGEPLYLDVPTGTLVFDIDNEGKAVCLADLKESGDWVTAARGGKGGRGNLHFARPTNRAPRELEVGTAGEEKTITFEMRLIADAGIIGFPNAGKSTLLSKVSAARPKIADYPFTTRDPVLGVVTVGNDYFTLVEIPGLIEGAHLGRGLGHEFLRHAMRTRVFVHLLDGTSDSSPSDMQKLNNELALFDPSLFRKAQLVAVNKIDLPEVRERIDSLRKEFQDIGISVFFISGETGEGVPDLMRKTWALIEKTKNEEEAKEMPAELPVLRPKPKGKGSSHSPPLEKGE